MNLKRKFEAWTPAFAGVTLVAFISITAAAPKPTPSPQSTPHRIRMGDIRDTPTWPQRIEQSIVTVLGLGLFFWAPHARIGYSSSSGSVNAGK